MKLSTLARRAERRERNQTLVDLNLVSLIDIFTILIFFLLANASDVEVLPSTKAVKLPESTAEQAPRETVVVVVSREDIVVQGRRIISLADAMRADTDVIEVLKAELDYHAGRTLVKTTPGRVGKDITIMGDKDISYRILKKIMVTCARANYSNIAFAVMPKSG